MKSSFKNILVNLDLIITGLALMTLIGCTFMGVIMRYLFNTPIIWLEEVQVWCIIWVVYIGAAAVFRYGGHVAIEILVDALPKSLQKIIGVAATIFVGFLLIFLIVQGTALTIQMANSHRMTSILRIPYPVLYVALPVGCFLMLVNMVAQTIKTLRQPDADAATAE